MLADVELVPFHGGPIPLRCFFGFAAKSLASPNGV
jgi:hypothetical protein